MNRQPYDKPPPRRWESKLSPWWVRLWRGPRRRELHRDQRIVHIGLEGLEHLRQPLTQGNGLLITPNHSFHWDSSVLMEAGDRLRRPFHFLVAWQAFAVVNRFDAWSFQMHGCFSIDRENADLSAFREAVGLLRDSPFPLVIFPEGDIYHTNDRVTPFREGAAAIALAAARKAHRPIVCVPCAIKFWYLDDPTPPLLALMDRLERRLFWQPRPDLPLVDRVYRLGEGLLALKELEYLGAPQRGLFPERKRQLKQELLRRLHAKYGLGRRAALVPEQVKVLRRAIVDRLLEEQPSPAYRSPLLADLDTLFVVMQLFSYPGDYVAEKPSIERLAETLDKFEEDLLRVKYPTVRGRRRVTVRFGSPIPISAERGPRDATERLTRLLQDRVQGMLDELNAQADVGRQNTDW